MSDDPKRIARVRELDQSGARFVTSFRGGVRHDFAEQVRRFVFYDCTKEQGAELVEFLEAWLALQPGDVNCL